MTQNSTTTAQITLTDADKRTLRTAAYGAVTLMSYADVAGSPHKVATNGTYALAAATGQIGHILAAKTNDIKLNAKSAAALADQVLPALTATMSLLNKQNPAEAANFRNTVTIALEAAGSHREKPSFTMTEMARLITQALNAA